jgi:hypothetical protein
MILNPFHEAEATFCVHLIAISGVQRRPKVRMLFVATEGADAVYEGQGTWAKCVRWIKQLPSMEVAKHDLDAAKRDFGRNRYAVLRGVTASLLDLESFGLQRVDRETKDSSVLAIRASLAE